MVVALTAYSLVIGMNTALETLVSQAFGRQNLRDCGLYLHRAILMVTLFLIPLGFALPFTSKILQGFGIDTAAADLAARYMMTFMPGLFLNAYADALDIFLLGMGKTYIIMYMQLAVTTLHLFFVWFFVSQMGLGVVGAANAHNLTAVITFILQFSYCHYCPDI